MAERHYYTNLTQHATPTDEKHLVTKGYVDAALNRKIKDAARVVATSDLDCTYSAANKTLTQNAPAALVIDGVTLAEGDRILVAGQTDATQNGVYALTTLGTGSTAAVLTRADDFNDSAKIPVNVLIPVSEGTQNADTMWQLTNDNAVTLDTSPLTFAKFKSDGGGVKSFSTTITGDGSATEFPINHGLGTERVQVSVVDAATKEVCIFGWEITSANVVTLKADVVLENTDSFIVTVVG